MNSDDETILRLKRKCVELEQELAGLAQERDVVKELNELAQERDALKTELEIVDGCLKRTMVLLVLRGD